MYCNSYAITCFILNFKLFLFANYLFQQGVVLIFCTKTRAILVVHFNLLKILQILLETIKYESLRKIRIFLFLKY